MGCQTSNQKSEEAKENVEVPRHYLADVKKEIKKDSILTVRVQEWKIFRNDAEASIRSNDLRIGAIKKKMSKSGNTKDGSYPETILVLENKNKELEDRMNGYEKNGSDWELFKSEFNQDMGQLGHTLKNFRVNNKKRTLLSKTVAIQ